MRLRQIKIAGFKSFADPVLIELDEPVIGIVGPNGCGKSNIIDAVRWVLGEARVAELRGSTSMKELIFSGSAGRKPMGRASVELVLTNEDGRLSGPWASYAEVSVKRQVTAEGNSTYSINGQVVRRRDVQEIFLGTGLGPRSYAIISQGMIASFVKARPEELRAYLEEAAGVSLYRERRRETENLLASTAQNLERVQDLQAIKAEETARLEAEATVARQWKELTQQKEDTEALWYFLQYEEVRQALDQLKATIAKTELQLEEKRTAIRQGEEALPHFKAKLDEAAGRADTAQKALRDAERTLMLFEGERKRLIEARTQAQNVEREAGEAIAQKRGTLTAVEAELLKLKEDASLLEEKLELLLEEAEALQEVRFEKEEQLEGLRDATRELEAKNRQTVTRWTEAKNRVAELGRRQEDLRRRLSKLALDEAQSTEVSEESLTIESENLEILEETVAEALDAQEEAEAQLAQARSLREKANEAYFAKLAQEKELSAKLSTLEAIQKKAEAGDKLSHFEEEAGLVGLRRLAESVQVAPEWAGALEATLRFRANAVELRFFDVAKDFSVKRPPAPLAFVDAGPGAAGVSVDDDLLTPSALNVGDLTFDALVTKVELKSDGARRAVPRWLAGCYAAPSFDAAMRVRKALPGNVTLVTPEGDRITAAGVDFWTASDPAEAMISRRLEIERLEEALWSMADELGALDSARQQAATRLESAERHLQACTATMKRAQAQLQQQHLKVEALRQTVEAARRRQADLKKSRDELNDEYDMVEAEIETAMDAADALEVDYQKAEGLTAQKARELKSAEAFAKQAMEAAQKARHGVEMARLQVTQTAERVRLNTERQKALTDDIEREGRRAEEAKRRLAEMNARHDDKELDAALNAFKAAEVASTEATDGLTQAQQHWELAQNALREEQATIMPLTESLGAARGDAQVKEGLKVQFDERLTELAADRLALSAKVEADRPKINGVRQKVQRLMNEIAALGPINHAALEHLEAAQAAMALTAKQVEDLEAAMATLEGAIRKIDQETRERMRETFDEVNGYLGETFTELFGGGTAALSMTGDDILSAGVEIRAQPPGKRNNSVRLLSGGEQALTATALVFGLFKLNPAPFCLLDEVDAPLDEANQARLAQMCTRLSGETQFLLITHHRVTMEYARALIGVTMKEPGVSRVVSVAVEEAVKMTENG